MMKIVFMGSPAFALPCIRALKERKHDILAVFTQPDKPAGRGLKLQACPVATFARESDLELFQPKTLRSPEIQNKLKKLNPDLIVVVAYGKYLPAEVLQLPKYGCINVHASLLPKYRGAAPINWAIINGEAETGITTMLLNEEMDAGDMLLKRKTNIEPEETAQDIHDRLAKIGAELLLETVLLIEQQKLQPVFQNHTQASLAPKLKKQDGVIDWQKGAVQLKNQIRGTLPWPVSFTHYQGKTLRIFKAEAVHDNPEEQPGTVVRTDDELGVATGFGTLYLLEVQLEGKRRMRIEEFLKGHKIQVGEKLI
ncbi:MAG: methionyl-tRNA formyltransferase [Pseudomonadota bacterium]